MTNGEEFWFKVFDSAWSALGAIGAGLWALWAFLNKRIDKVAADAKAHTDESMATARAALHAVDMEVTRQRDVSAKIFDKLEDMSRESADRHERLLVALHTGLAGKADK